MQFDRVTCIDKTLKHGSQNNFVLLYFGVQVYGGEITDLTRLCSKIGFSLPSCIPIPYPLTSNSFLGYTGQPIAQSVTIESVTMENCNQNDRRRLCNPQRR